MATTQISHAKQQVVDAVPARIKHIQFGILYGPRPP